MEYYSMYIRHKRELFEALKEHSKIVDEKVELFQRTQPSSVDMGKVGRGTSTGTDKVDSYLIKNEERQVDARLKASKEICEEMIRRLDYDEKMVRMSSEAADRVYALRFLDRLSIGDIASRLHYDQSYIYKIVKKIEQS